MVGVKGLIVLIIFNVACLHRDAFGWMDYSRWFKAKRSKYWPPRSPPSADNVFVFKDGTIDWVYDKKEQMRGKNDKFNVCVTKVPDNRSWCVKGSPPLYWWNRQYAMWESKEIMIKISVHEMYRSSRGVKQTEIAIDRDIEVPRVKTLALYDDRVKLCHGYDKAKFGRINACWSNGQYSVCKQVSKGAPGYQAPVFQNVSDDIEWSLKAKYCKGNKCGFATKIMGSSRKYLISGVSSQRARFWKIGYDLSWNPPTAVGLEYMVQALSHQKITYEEIVMPMYSCDLRHFVPCAELGSSLNLYTLVGLQRGTVRKYGIEVLEQCSIIRQYPITFVLAFSVFSFSSMCIFVGAIWYCLYRCEKSRGYKQENVSAECKVDGSANKQQKIYKVKRIPEAATATWKNILESVKKCMGSMKNKHFTDNECLIGPSDKSFKQEAEIEVPKA